MPVVLLDSVAQKLAHPPKDHEPFPLDALPRNLEDEALWRRIQHDYDLTLPELSCLKNYAQSSFSQTNVVQLLEEIKGEPLNVQEIEYAFVDHAELCEIIAHEPDETERERLVYSLWQKISLHVGSTEDDNSNSSSSGQPYVFGKALHGVMLGDGTELQWVLRGSSVDCAKIMTDVAALEREYAMAQQIHQGQTCPTIMPVLDFFPLSKRRACMIMPYYPVSLADFPQVSEECCINAAICCLATIQALQNKQILPMA